jgi:pimeloyl-ACP methyl ester carboxylesterase
LEERDLYRTAEGSGRLGDYFSDYSFEAASGAGHFVHYEKPEAANHEIIGFFSGR